MAWLSKRQGSAFSEGGFSPVPPPFGGAERASDGWPFELTWSTTTTTTTLKSAPGQGPKPTRWSCASSVTNFTGQPASCIEISSCGFCHMFLPRPFCAHTCSSAYSKASSYMPRPWYRLAAKARSSKVNSTIGQFFLDCSAHVSG